MSADNGWILRKNIYGKFVLQEYCASSDRYPRIDDPKAQEFSTVDAALDWYQKEQPYSEYGLTVNTITITYNTVFSEGDEIKNINTLWHEDNLCARHGSLLDKTGRCHHCEVNKIVTAAIKKNYRDGRALTAHNLDNMLLRSE